MILEVTLKKRNNLLVALFPKEFVEENNIQEGDKLFLVIQKFNN